MTDFQLLAKGIALAGCAIGAGAALIAGIGHVVNAFFLFIALFRISFIPADKDTLSSLNFFYFNPHFEALLSFSYLLKNRYSPE